MRTWIIGSDGACDIVVAQPRVSRRHCRFTELADGHLLEDLGSSNGTYVNGEPIAGPTRVSAGDRITLGVLVPMPWPPASGIPGTTIRKIGRVAGNDVVIDDPRVSSNHARLLVSGDRTLIEDAGSANGTFLNSPDRRVTEATPLFEKDTVYFGSFAVPAARLLAARPSPAAAMPDPPPIPPAIAAFEAAAGPLPASPPAPAPISPPAATTSGSWAILLLAQAPVLALLILLAFGRGAGATSGGAIASTVFATAIAAVWLGGTLAVWADIAARLSSGRDASPASAWLAAAGPGGTLAAVAGLCAIQCAVLLGMVSWGSGLRGPWAAELGVLVLASGIGLALAGLVLSIRQTPAVSAAILLVAFAAMTLLGGRIVRLSDSGAVATVAAAMPSRWAFEGLLLLEQDRPSPSANVEGAKPAADVDPAEDFFPADSHRMGPRADALALAFMLVGLVGTGAYVSTTGRAPS